MTVDAEPASERPPGPEASSTAPVPLRDCLIPVVFLVLAMGVVLLLL